MTKKEYHFLSADQATTIYAVAYVPDEPRGYVQLVHDCYEHIGRYTTLMERICEAGYIAFGADIVGHGRSVQNDASQPVALRSANCLLDDIHTLFLMVVRDFSPEIRKQIVYAGPHGGSAYEVSRPTLRCIIGMGFGSALAKMYAIRYTDCNALVLCADRGYAGSVRSQLRICQRQLRVESEQTVSNRVSEQMSTDYDGRFEGTAKNRWRLASSHALRRYQDDPLCARSYDLGSWRTILQIEGAYRLRAWVEQLPKYMPVYFISGAQDVSNDCTAELMPALNMMKMKNRVNVFYRFYEDSRHDVLFDRKRNEALADILFFIGQVQKQMC